MKRPCLRQALFFPAWLVVFQISAPACDVLIDFGDTWRFFRGNEHPSVPENAWRLPDFDDSTWEIGPSGFGFGDGDDATVLADMRFHYQTLFIRRTFQVANPLALNFLVLKAHFDDGFVCYINGVEAARSHAGNGDTFNHSSGASGQHEVTEDPALFDLSDAMPHLVPGENTVAVLGLNNGQSTDDDFSLNLNLTANDPSFECPRELTCVSSFAENSVTLRWTNRKASDAITVTRNGAPVAGSPFPGDTVEFVDTHPGDFGNDYAVIAGFGHCDCEPLRCSGTASFALVAEEEVWRYFGNPEPPFGPPPSWRELTFNDSGWNSGPASIGYGDDDDATVINTMRDSYMTLFTRKVFQAPDPSLVPGLRLSVDYDDGFVAYLGGVEIARSPSMEHLGDEVPFNAEADYPHEAGYAEDFPVAASFLAEGDNVLAVEVHNVSLGSADISFEASLYSDPCYHPVSGLECARDPATGDVSLSWNPGDVDSIVVTREGVAISGSPFPGDTTDVVDADAPDRENIYHVTGIVGPVECRSASCTARCEACTARLFRRGDTDGGGEVDVTDAIRVFNFLFQSGPTPPCLDAADADDSGSLDITDGIRILCTLFLDWCTIPLPGPDICGEDPTEDALAFCEYDACR